MSFTRRHLPHWIPDDALIFVTWRLAVGVEHCLTRPEIAQIIKEALCFGESVKSWYSLTAWVIMPNHVHVLMRPSQNFSEIMRWLKWTTARRANTILARSGTFWQDESFDRWIRDRDEFAKTVNYIESNPVTAGLAAQAEHWPWSSRASGTGGLAACQR